MEWSKVDMERCWTDASGNFDFHVAVASALSRLVVDFGGQVDGDFGILVTEVFASWVGGVGCGAEIMEFSIGEEDGGFFGGFWAFSIGGKGHMVGDGVGQWMDGSAVEGVALVCMTRGYAPHQLGLVLRNLRFGFFTNPHSFLYFRRASSDECFAFT
nr:hypothetical protein CFP56_54224 [Quercus suber]